MLPQSPPHSDVGPYRWPDFLALDEDDQRELIDGHLLEIEAPTAIHQWIVTFLTVQLSNWALPRNAGIALTSGYKIRVNDRRGVMPDVAFFRRGRKLPAQGLDHGGPDLAVEIVSPSSGRYDRVTKLNWYASIGTSEYWIVDPEDQVLERLVLEPGKGYRIAGAYSGTDVFSPDSFEGLTFSLSSLWTLPDEEAK